jgi:hypothetical protein
MAGYSATPLVKKLGIKPHSSLLIQNSPSGYFEWIDPLPENVSVKKRVAGELDFIHLFVTTQNEFKKQFIANMKTLKKDGMMWVSWPKKSARIATDLDENIIRDFGLEAGLVDVKVCAVDETWSALKFVYRLIDR